MTSAYRGLPLRFEANWGQTDPCIKFLARGSGYTLFLTSREAILSLRGNEEKWNVKNEYPLGIAFPSRNAEVLLPNLSPAPSPQPLAPAVVRMKLVGANPRPRIRGLQELPGKSNYFIGNDLMKWRRNVPSYAKVRYEDVYPAVDMVYYGDNRQLEYDFVVAPGVDPKVIKLDIVGAQGPASLQINAQGDLAVETDGGEIRFHKPVMYQPEASPQSSVVSSQRSVFGGESPSATHRGRRSADDGLRTFDNRQRRIQNRKSLSGRWTLRGKHQVGFQVAGYDPGKPLIIDPAISFSTFLGGGSNDTGYGIAVDSSGNAFVTGNTGSTNFPTASPIQSANGGDADVFVTKLKADGSALAYSTYLGGESFDKGLSIAVDSSGNAYVTGYTTSPNFPTTSGAFQTTYGGNGDAFVTQINADGSKLVYSSYLGGGGADFGQGIALDASGNAYVTGLTESTNFPTTNPLQAANAGAADAFVTKIKSDGSALVYSTYFGGGDADSGQGIAVDAAGNAYVTGNTLSTNFPTASPLQAASGGSLDAFLAKLNPTGSALVYSTYLGGSGFDSGMGIAVDSSGNAYVAGYTSSTNFPTAIPIQASYGGGVYDAFVTKLNAAGSALVFSTYLGGSDTEQGFAIALDKSGSIYVTGYTQSDNFPTAKPVQSSIGGGLCGTAPCSDAFVTALDASGSSLVYSTYLGGGGADFGEGIAVDSSGNAYVTGSTGSSNFPVTVGVFQPAYAGPASSTDAFITKITLADAPAATLFPGSLSFGNQATGTTSAAQNLTVTNSGSASLTISSIVASSSFSETNTCAGSLAPGGANCAINVTFSPSSTGKITGTVTITDDAAGSPQVINLTGTGVKPAPAVTFSSTSLDFGSQVFGTPSPPQTVTLTNSGSAALNITKIATAADYTQANTCPSSLDAAASCAILVTFTPKGTGRRLGDLTVTDNATGSPQRVSLTGNGIPAYSLSSNSTSLTSDRGTTSVTFTISATGPSTFTAGIKLACISTGRATCSFNPTSIKVGQNSTLTVNSLSTIFGDSLSFTVNGTSGSQTASLSLNILLRDFSLFAAPPSHTVTGGQTATYTVNISPVNGFASQLSLSCAGLPTDAPCAISPNSVKMDGSSTATVTVTITTKARSIALPPISPRMRLPGLFWLLGLAALAGIAKLRRRRISALGATLGTAALCLVLLSSSCNEFFTPIIRSTGEGTFVVSITAKSGSLSHSATVTLTIL